jgi:Glycosyl hydrolase catalytic core
MQIVRFLMVLTALLAVSSPVVAQHLESRASASSKFLDFIAPRKPLQRALLGVNAFANDPRFGTIRAQFQEVRSTLGLRHVRILFAWNDQVQPRAEAPPFFGFYDELAKSLPPGLRATVVVTGIPSWMADARNWIDGNPRATYVEKWVKPIVSRYRENAQITAFQFWNEPNDRNNPHNTTMAFTESPANFVEFTAIASNASKEIAPRKLVVSAATTSIIQNFPRTLRYNQSLVEAGILPLIDVFGVHVYGSSYENLALPNSAGDFLRTVSKPIWVTESGAQGVLKQREYAQRMFPYLLGKYPAIKRVYIYQFTEITPASTSYGLRTPDRKNPVSDLYVYLRG